MINFKNFNGFNIFFIGIGGISMSSLVHFCCKEGAFVSGSDSVINDETKKLNKFGIITYLGHDEKHISSDINIVVYTGAIKDDNVELVKAKKLNIPCYERSEFLGVILKMYDNSIVVAGTHGKTTTTAMLGEMFLNAELNPSVHLGGDSLRFGNYLLGGNNYFITEGCEYRNSIKYLTPHTSVITNIELDHTDFYSNKSEIEDAFLNLANNTKENVVVFENNDFAKKITSKVNVITAGFDGEYDIVGKNISLNENGTYSFDVFYRNYIGKFQTDIIGEHNAKNALCAIAVGLICEIKMGTIYMSLRNFKGVKRRFEKVGEINKIPVICDYAHHPTEIVNSINAIKQKYKSVAVVFQPHTYSRTIGLKQDFIKSFRGANNLIVFKTYPAREKYISGGSAKELYKSIKKSNKFYCETKKELKNILRRLKDDIVLVLGAGDIYQIVKSIIK